VLIFAAIEVSCSKQFPNEIEEAFIADFSAEEINQDPVFDFIEARSDVSFHEPVEGRPFSAYFAQGGMTTAVWPEAVAGIMEIRSVWTFIDAFEDESNDLLHDFIVCRGYS